MTGANKPKPAFVTTLTDQGWYTATLAERAVHVARSQAGATEFPKGSNWGKAVQAYLKVVGVFTPAPWCAAFVTWCLIEAGADRKKLPKFAASTYWWWKWARDSKRDSPLAKRGHIGVYNNPGGGHIWFCLDGTEPYRTLEGNTNPGGSREGYGVFERKRYRTDMAKHARACFIRVGDDLY